MKQQLIGLLLILSVFGVNSVPQGQYPQQQQQQQQHHLDQVQSQSQIQPQYVQVQHQQQPSGVTQIQQIVPIAAERGDQFQPQYGHGGQGQVGGFDSGVSSGVVIADPGQGHQVSASAPAGIWEEATSVVGNSGWMSTGFSALSEMFLNIGIFQALFIPAIFLTAAFMLYAAYSSPYNAQSHYLVDSIPGNGGYGQGGLFGNGWKRSLNSFAAKKIEELTPKVLEAIKDFAAKHH